ncbi:MAG: hypothetical protein ACJ76P_00825 [Actinomycetota bacterium]
MRAVDFRAVDLRAVDFRAVDLRRLVDFLAVAICHPLSRVRTPCASGVVSPVRSSRPRPRSARRAGGRS